jgi:hypothetical protein
MKSLFLVLFLCLILNEGYSQKTAEEWQAIIDTTWGEGLPTADKLAIFDLIWNSIDDDYACFHNLNINWDSLRTVFRPEIETGVSRGRFYGIISHLYLALQEAHTKFLDLGIYHSDLKPGIPLLVYQSGYYYNDHGHFGAGLTPLPDSSLLVYKVIENHPLGLESGDIVLGYDGIPWKILYKQLLAAHLPITSITEPFVSLSGLYTFGGSSDRSAAHIWLTSAGLNWHLFDVIDIVKYGSNDTLHLQTSTLEELDTQLICTEQLPVPGVPMPDLSQVSTDMITWGVIDGTQIGYIYASHWAEFLGADAAFTNAVDKLLDEYQTEGLIIDSRLNAGGQPWAANDGFSRLYNFNAEILDFAERSDPNDRYALKEISGPSGDRLRFNADPFLYDKPIAVLTGPLTWSAGDANAMRLKYHPMTRFFGKPTNTAYILMGYDWNFLSSYPDWFGAYAPMNTYLLDNSSDYLTHVGFDVDEEVWLTQEDVVKGEDTVVKRAIEWIRNLAYAHDVTVDKTFALAGTDQVLINTFVKNPNENDVSVEALINADNGLLDSLKLFDDGLHNDEEAADGLWGNSWMTSNNEADYEIDVRTYDSTVNTSRTLPKIQKFTTIGPITYDSFTPYILEDSIPNPDDVLSFKIYLKNNGSESSAEEIEARLSSLTSKVVVNNYLSSFGDITAGSRIESSSGFSVTISSDIYEDTTVYLPLTISSRGYHYWTDSLQLDIITTVSKPEINVPTTYSLEQNHPNPFNPVTIINYQLPMSNDVELSIFNVLGQIVATLVSDKKQAGYHKVMWDASGFASGIYYYQLMAGDYQQVKKMILLK